MVFFEFCAQELPLVNQFTPEDYKAESQNWAISQAENGFLYVANNSGLLEFNGASWKLYPTPNETIIRSVKVVQEKIFTGFYMDFGFWEKDEYGLLQYTSIVKQKEISLLDDEQIWNIVALDGWMLFQSLQRIYIYNLETGFVKKINSRENAVISKMFKVDDNVYFQETGSGIFKIEKGIPVLVSDAEVFKQVAVVLAFKKENQLVFLTDSKGFFTIDKPYFFDDNELQVYLSDKTIYTAKKLSNNNFVIGTISNGVVSATEKGKVIFEINQRKGLLNNTVLTVFEDNSNNVWLGLDNGISKIDITSSLRVYKDVEGTLGTVYASSLHNGFLYLGTNQGLFYKKYPSKSEFEFIQGSQGQVWHLTKFKETLFCGHNSGMFIVDQGDIKKISNIHGAWGIKKLTDKSFLQGNYDGLYVFEKSLKGWGMKNKITGFNRSARYFELYHDNTVFINHEYKGVYKLKLNDSLTKVVNIAIDSSVQKGIHSSLIKYQDNIIYAHKDGVFRYHDKLRGFMKDTLLNQLIKKETFLSGRLIYDDASKKLFSFSKQNINFLRPDKFSANSIIEERGVSNALRKGAVGYENIQKLSGTNYLLGTLNGYLVVDLKENEENEYWVGINSIKNHELNSESSSLRLNESITLPAKQNNLEFQYSVPNLSNDKQVVYQYMLKGYMDEWSPWLNEYKVLFENLPFGDYTFQVRAKVGNQLVDNTPEYTFTIKRPWYFSNMAILIYVLSILAFSVFMDRIYKSYYGKKREEELKKQEQEFRLQNLAKEKEFIEIKNKQLNQDVDSKNRELAISTMSMIKKNELLGSIKKEILNITDEKSIKNVVKIIDANINNNDDRKMFEEAFNNADKDFIKKIKKLHNNLTPNDLRLCAYLRFNLSSKEIAPLLNISSRSVEVKRYRLRKKMNLAHDVNLTTYILEI